MLIKQTKNMTESERITAQNSNNQYLQALTYVTVGTIYPYAGETAPETFMICDGSALDVTEYAELFSVIGYRYGGKDETFYLPDLRGRVLVGQDASDADFKVIGQCGGEKAHKLTSAELPSHRHYIHVAKTGGETTGNTDSNPLEFLQRNTAVSNESKNVISTEQEGANASHNNLQPYTVCNFIIKVCQSIVVPEVVEEPKQATDIAYDNSKSGLESENIQDAIDELAAKTENAVSIDSWQGVQRIVNLGLAHNAFKIGDKLKCNHSEYGVLTWDVVDATPERLSLCAHNIIDTLEFDEREALYYAENGLAAGNYWFSLMKRGWYEPDSYKSFNFTLTNDVPARAHLVLDVAYNAPLNGSNVIVYADANSTEILETAPIIEGIGLTFLGYADGSTPNLNHIMRAILGSNSYKESAIRQWLNNDGEVGNAWTPQTIFDRPSYGAVRRPGFLNGLDADFLEVISYAEYDTFQYDGGVTGRETLTDRFMLPSRSEVYAGAVGGIPSNIEGEPFPYFSQFSDHSSPSTAADTNRVKTRLKDSKAAPWWTRTPNVYSQYIVHTIFASGKLSDGNDAVNAWGVVPVCHIIKKTGGNTDV